jgi:hypothetical protein
VSLLHHAHHHVPFEDTPGERRQLVVRCNDLAHRNHALEAEVQLLRAENARLRRHAAKRWWRR